MVDPTSKTELTLAEAAALARRCEWTVRQWVSQKRIAARKVAGRVFVDAASLNALLAGESIGAAQLAAEGSR